MSLGANPLRTRISPRVGNGARRRKFVSVRTRPLGGSPKPAPISLRVARREKKNRPGSEEK
jgi:hypothetical protein